MYVVTLQCWYVNIFHHSKPLHKQYWHRAIWIDGTVVHMSQHQQSGGCEYGLKLMLYTQAFSI